LLRSVKRRNNDATLVSVNIKVRSWDLLLFNRLLLILLLVVTPLFSWDDHQEIQDPGMKTVLGGMHGFTVHYTNYMFYTINLDTPGYIETGVYNSRSKDGVIFNRPFYRWRSGPPTTTGRDFDFYVDGAGRAFFAVQMPTNIAYTRDGRFVLDSSRRIVTMSGNYPLLGQDGHIYIPEYSEVSVSAAGMIYADGEPIDRIRVVVFNSKSDMTPDNIETFNNAFFLLTKEIPFNTDPKNYKIVQGMLHRNNVLKAINGDIGMAKNSYDATVKTGHMINKALGTAASLASP
jgi:flagellar basal body rod protein FlgG